MVSVCCETGHNEGMPKISAPTVAEHRAAQQNALLAAAEAIIADEGIAGISARTVTERAGLARSSFYEYFASKDDLLAAVALAAFEAWAVDLEAALVAAPPGRARLHAYVDAALRMTADGKHALATVLQQADLAPTSRDTIMAMHDTLATPLRTLLDDLGVGDAPTQAALVQGLVTAGMQLIGHGGKPHDVAATINELLDRGIPS